MRKYVKRRYFTSRVVRQRLGSIIVRGKAGLEGGDCFGSGSLMFSNIDEECLLGLKALEYLN